MARTLKHGDYYRLKDGRRVVVLKGGKSAITYAARHAQGVWLQMTQADFQAAVAEKLKGLRDDPLPQSNAPLKEPKRKSRVKVRQV